MVETAKDYREPATEIVDTPDGVKLVVELPGVTQDSIKMAVSKDIVKIDAEGRRGKFSTMEVIPFEPDSDRVSVSFSQGVLEVMLPRKTGGSAAETPDQERAPFTGEEQPAAPQEDLEGFKEEMERLNRELIRVSEEKASMEERVSYLQRDFQNLRRRHEAEKDRMVERRIRDIGIDLVEVMDNFERAREIIENGGSETNNVRNILMGLSMVENHVAQLFNRLDITRIQSVGQCFDPTYHEAVGRVERTDVEDEVIVEEKASGYKHKDEVLRPAQVIINKVPEAKPECGGNKAKPKGKISGSKKKK
ncbi:MAG: nucleotide exchange factor GrpE [Thermoplasmatota archaeon]